MRIRDGSSCRSWEELKCKETRHFRTCTIRPRLPSADFTHINMFILSGAQEPKQSYDLLRTSTFQPLGFKEIIIKWCVTTLPVRLVRFRHKRYRLPMWLSRTRVECPRVFVFNAMNHGAAASARTQSLRQHKTTKAAVKRQTELERFWFYDHLLGGRFCRPKGEKFVIQSVCVSGMVCAKPMPKCSPPLPLQNRFTTMVIALRCVVVDEMMKIKLERQTK